MTKQEAREVMKKRRAGMGEQERARQNQEIFCRLFAEPVWESLEWFFPFVSFGTEVDTLEIIRRVFAMRQEGAGIRMAVPRVQGREMAFYEVCSFEDLEEGYRGIWEPKAYCRMVEARRGLMLLPGLAFDREGRRVGYGGGYYDRYLSRYGNRELLTWAVAYDFQVVDSIETEAYDIRLQRILTAHAQAGREEGEMYGKRGGDVHSNR